MPILRLSFLPVVLTKNIGTLSNYQPILLQCRVCFKIVLARARGNAIPGPLPPWNLFLKSHSAFQIMCLKYLRQERGAQRLRMLFYIEGKPYNKFVHLSIRSKTDKRHEKPPKKIVLGVRPLVHLGFFIVWFGKLNFGSEKNFYLVRKRFFFCPENLIYRRDPTIKKLYGQGTLQNYKSGILETKLPSSFKIIFCCIVIRKSYYKFDSSSVRVDRGGADRCQKICFRSLQK